MTFVVLQEHVARYAIDRAIHDRYPDASLVILPEATPGALVTAIAGCRAVGEGWLLISDCDHAFEGRDLAASVTQSPEAQAGFLCHFRSHDPAYSYAEYDDAGFLKRTVEKRVISDLAIAGAYGFRNCDSLLSHAADYIANCPYDEPFVSGIYNTIVASGGIVRGGILDRHVSFGTPAEYAAAEPALASMRGWFTEEVVR